MVMMVCMACRTKKPIPQKSIEKTAFYTIELSKDTVKKTTAFSIKKVQIVNAIINYKPDKDKAKNPYYLKIEITDKDKNIRYVLTEHPLYKRFDIYSENGEIESKSISLQQGEVTFKIPYFSEYKKIKLTEFVNSVEVNTLIINNEK
jgi:hypothetical protein